MPKMTLKQVGRKAMTDPKFWTELRDHTERTLAGIQMPAKDKTVLRDVLKGKVKVNLKTLMNGAHKKGVPYHEDAWRRSWQGMWQ